VLTAGLSAVIVHMRRPDNRLFNFANVISRLGLRAGHCRVVARQNMPQRRLIKRLQCYSVNFMGNRLGTNTDQSNKDVNKNSMQRKGLLKNN
jgi:hypothetical protein